MQSGIVCLSLILLASMALTGCGKARRQTGLEISYGANGIQRLSFNGTTLEDLAKYPADAFHIWHIKATALHGKLLTDRQYGWGEVNNGRTWNAAAHTWNYQFIWGSISVQFAQKGNSLEVTVTEKNNADSGIMLDGATIYPFALHFPELPDGFGESSFEHLALRSGDPIPVAEFDQKEVSIIADASPKPLYRGFEPAGGGNSYFPIISSTAMDSMSSAYSRIDRPVGPGAADTFTVTLEFADVEAETR